MNPEQLVVGVLYTKDLLLLDPAHTVPVKTCLAIFNRPVVFVWGDTTASELLNELGSIGSQWAVVRSIVVPKSIAGNEVGDPYYQNVGLVTLSDILPGPKADERQRQDSLLVTLSQAGYWKLPQLSHFPRDEESTGVIASLHREFGGNNKLLLDESAVALVNKDCEEHEAAHSGGGGGHGPPMATGSFEAYFDTPIVKIIKARLPWLAGLLIVQSLSAFIMQGFEEMLAENLVIAFFVPCVVGTGGNAGNQPGVMVTRALGSAKLSKADLRRLVKKEATVAFLQALILGLLTMLRVLIQFPKDWASSLAISITIFTVVLASSFLGIFLNIGLSTCGIDPATAGAPIVSTSADIVGIALLCVVGYMLLDILHLGAHDVYV